MTTTAAAPPQAATRVAGHLLSGQVAAAACSLAINVLSARAMGPTGRGRVAFGLQLAYLLTAVAASGADRSYPALAPTGQCLPAAMRDVVRLMMPGVLLVAAGCLLAGAAAHRWSTLAFAAATTAVFAGNAATLVVRSAGVAVANGRAYFRVSLGGQLGLLGTAAVFAATQVRGPDWWLAGYAVCLGIPTIVMWRRKVERPNRALLGPARMLGLKLMPAVMANMLLLRADRLLLPVLGSYSELGVYVVVATFTELVAWPAQSYVDAHMPAWRRAILAGALRRVRILALLAGYSALAGTLVLLGGWLLVVPVFGSAYGRAVPLVAPLAAAAVMYSVSRVGVGFALAAERPRAVLAAEGTAMVVAMATYLLLIPRLGAMGAALGSLLGYTTAAAVALLLTVMPSAAKVAANNPPETGAKAEQVSSQPFVQ